MKRLGIILLVSMISIVIGGTALGVVNWGTYKGFPIVKIKIDNQEKTPSSPAIVVNGATYVPLRFVSENLGAKVDWDQTNKTVSITKSSSTTTPTTTKPITKQWVNVATLSGSTDKVGTIFKLSGIQTRLVYSVDGTYPVCGVYVMKEGTSLEKDGGSSVVIVTDNANDSTMLVKDAGNYYFDVKAANCNWTVTLQEYK